MWLVLILLLGHCPLLLNAQPNNNATTVAVTTAATTPPTTAAATTIAATTAATTAATLVGLTQVPPVVAAAANATTISTTTPIDLLSGMTMVPIPPIPKSAHKCVCHNCEFDEAEIRGVVVNYDNQYYCYYLYQGPAVPTKEHDHNLPAFEDPETMKKILTVLSLGGEEWLKAEDDPSGVLHSSGFVALYPQLIHNITQLTNLLNILPYNWYSTLSHTHDQLKKNREEPDIHCIFWSMNNKGHLTYQCGLDQDKPTQVFRFDTFTTEFDIYNQSDDKIASMTPDLSTSSSSATTTAVQQQVQVISTKIITMLILWLGLSQ